MMELYALVIYNSWMWAFRPKNKTPYEEITNKSETKNYDKNGLWCDACEEKHEIMNKPH